MEKKLMDVNGTRICYMEQGSGTPLLLIHGNTGSRRWFERVMHIRGARTIAPDLPNFGDSGPLPGPISIDAYADAASGFLHGLEIAHADVLGHSLGGSVAMSLALRHPGLVRRLILVDSAAPSGLQTPVDRHPLIEMMRTRKDVLAQALRAVVPTLADEQLFASLVDDAARMASPAWIGNAVALGASDYTAGCAAFKGPVLVIWGRKDVLVTEEMARATQAAFPNAHLSIVETVGHSLPVEDPARFVSTVEEFIAAGGKGA